MGHPLCIDVKNNKIVRMRPLHWDAWQPWESLNPWTIEARGKSFTVPKKSAPAPYALSYKNSIYAPDRVKFPLQRVDFDPNADPETGRKTENRGKSKYKRISWDEATDIISSEIKRIHDKYGVFGILCAGDGHGESKNIGSRHGANKVLLNYLGGYTELARNPDSWEGWVWGAKHSWGQEMVGKMADHTNVWTDALRNTELFIDFGDGETTPWGGGQIEMNSQLMYWCNDVGIEWVFIQPSLNYSGAIHGTKWIPVLPNTDCAWILAVNHVWITEGTYDNDFVEGDKWCVGFDKWKAYVLGDEDGIPKTPAWAAPECGIPDYTIKALARHWAKKVTCMVGSNFGSGFRGPFSSEPASMMVNSLAMQGLGNPGVYQLSYIEVGVMGLPGAYSAGGVTGAPMPGFGLGGITMGGAPASMMMGVAQKQFITKPMYSQCILDSPQSWYCTDHCPREGQFVKYTYPIPTEDGGTRFHMIWMDSVCNSVCLQYGFRLLAEGFRDSSIEFMVGEHMTMENDLLYADIILPVVRKGECDDINVEPFGGGGMFNAIYLEKTVALPGESKTDYECCVEVAKKLEKYGGIYTGLVNTYTKGHTYEEFLKICYDTLNDNVKAAIPWETLQEHEFFTFPADPNWEAQGFGGFAKFRADPEANPLETMTGKIEFERQDIKEHMPDDRERPPVPHYIIGGPGWSHDESIHSERFKLYPLLVLSNHPRWREHSQTNDSAWLHEIPTCRVKGFDGYLYEPAWINPADAAARGIVNGDIVKVYNDRGTILCGALVRETQMPGAVWIDHGSQVDLISDYIDRGGSSNLFCELWGVSQNCMGGENTSGYLVEIEKLSLDEMEQWKKDYPDAFARKYDYDSGLCASAWIVE
jgi:anaerobic selenocysteine-containing dehydrogenase